MKSLNPTLQAIRDEISNTCKLPKKDALIIDMLLTSYPEHITRDQILKSVLKYKFDPKTNIVEVRISRLRPKLKHLTHIQIKCTVELGYRIVIEKDNPSKIPSDALDEMLAQ